ncbi:14975_t:CDS:2, partial [Dentiscutata heterogama]
VTPPLDSPLTETDPCSRSFYYNIRMYKSALAFTSIEAKIDPKITRTSSIYTFCIYVVAIIMVKDTQGAEQLNQDIMLHIHEDGLQWISELHCCYTPLHYVLMFPRGKDGWHSNIPVCDTSNNIQYKEESDINNENEEHKSNKCVTAMNYFAYRL